MICLNKARFSENVAELLLIPHICRHYTETESRCLNFVNTVFYAKCQIGLGQIF